MRIVSLVPSATEMLFALGLGDRVVAVTHECDYPKWARQLPRLTRSVVPEGLSAKEIDKAVTATVGAGEPLYELDEERLRAAAPDLIVTQALCAVCAVSYEAVVEIAGRLPSRPRVLQQDPSTLGEVLEDVTGLGEAAGAEAAATEVRAELEGRLASVGAAVAGTGRPRVIALEWLDPPYVGGHWVPEMVTIAGGEDIAGPPGLRSPEVSWNELSGLSPDVVVAMPCGRYVEEALAEARDHLDRIGGLGPSRVFAVDAASSFSRPGPRLVDGVELLAHLLHPEVIDAPGGIGFAEVRG